MEIGREARSAVLFDIGGGSSEIAVLRIDGQRSPRLANHITHWTSLPVGVVTLSERHGGRHVTPEIFEDMVQEVGGMLSSFEAPPAEDLNGIAAYNSYQDFIADTTKPEYKGNWQNPREAEAFRELCAKRLAKMNMHEAARAADFAPANDAEAIVQLDPSIPLAVAQAGVQTGGFPTRESREAAYSDPRYKVSEDWRNYVAAREALTADFGA